MAVQNNLSLTCSRCSSLINGVFQEKQADPRIMETLIGDQGEDVSLTACLAAERTSLCQVQNFLPDVAADSLEDMCLFDPAY